MKNPKSRVDRDTFHGTYDVVCGDEDCVFLIMGDFDSEAEAEKYRHIFDVGRAWEQERIRAEKAEEVFDLEKFRHLSFDN